MVDAERLARLLRRATEDIGRLRVQARDAAALLTDEVRLDHVKYRFVTAIEACLDAAMHILATEGYRAPDANADAIRELARHGVLTHDVAEAVARAVGFRNVLVHRYAEVIDERVIDHLGALERLEDFVDQVTVRFL